MIYVCEYDKTIENACLMELGKSLPLPQSDNRGHGDDPQAAAYDSPWWAKRRQRILAWLLLEHALQNEYGLSLDQLQIDRDAKGKPRSASYPGIHFNISHCETACACVVGTQECGIDIEQKFPYRASLARRICHPREWKIFQEILSQEQQVQLQILWSLKESFVKRDGRGLGYGMETIDLSDLMPFPQQGQSEEQGLWWNAADNYTIAVCTPQKIETVICMGEQQLMDHR